MQLMRLSPPQKMQLMQPPMQLTTPPKLLLKLRKTQQKQHQMPQVTQLMLPKQQLAMQQMRLQKQATPWLKVPRTLRTRLKTLQKKQLTAPKRR